MNKRKLKLEKYGISKARYQELKGFCEQYSEWKEEINNFNYLSSPNYKMAPGNPNKGTTDMTGNAAIKMERHMSYVEMIERCAKEADSDYWFELIECICCGASINNMIATKRLPLSIASYYDKRKYFFVLLDREKNK